MIGPHSITLSIDEAKTLPIEQELDMSGFCVDFDEDCDSVTCKTKCWLLDPSLGKCPYLEGILH